MRRSRDAAELRLRPQRRLRQLERVSAQRAERESSAALALALTILCIDPTNAGDKHTMTIPRT